MSKLVRISFLCTMLMVLSSAGLYDSYDELGITQHAVDLSVNIWKNDMKKAKIDYIMGLNNISAIRIIEGDGKHAGIQSGATGIIYISKSRVYDGPYSILATVYHEFGHAVFHLPHGSCDLMDTHVYSEKKYRDNWEQYQLDYTEVCRASILQAKNKKN